MRCVQDGCLVRDHSQMGKANIQGSGTGLAGMRWMTVSLTLLALAVVGFMGFEIGQLGVTSQTFQVPRLIVGSCDEQVEEEGPPEPRFENLFYLKTHKTGSTSIAHALVRYAKRQNLTTVRAPGDVYISKNNTTPDRWDALVAHHAAFNRQVLSTYLHREPEVLLTSIRLPLQRQLSWFRQQNSKVYDVLNYDGDSEECLDKKDEVLKYFDEWAEGHKTSSQMSQLTESADRPRIKDNVTAIVDQFDFVFLRERMKESYECLCKKLAIRLCDIPMEELNVKPGRSCAERLLVDYRSAALLNGAERDLLLYEHVNSQIAKCQADLPAYCRCQ